MLVGHQGGWDEVLFVAVPLGLLSLVLLLAKRRAEAEARDARSEREDE